MVGAGKQGPRVARGVRIHHPGPFSRGVRNADEYDDAKVADESRLGGLAARCPSSSTLGQLIPYYLLEIRHKCILLNFIPENVYFLYYLLD